VTRPTRIVFYDGHCGLCNRVVRWLLRIDRGALLHFAPLQGSTAKRLLQRKAGELDAIVYWRQGLPLLDTSNAIGMILREMPWPWRALSAPLGLPQGPRDWVYRQLAKRRYRLFGRLDRCPLPDPSVKRRFLG
jgi:predicted DCC family thiol-disulfide oxidoreductase YuxK